MSNDVVVANFGEYGLGKLTEGDVSAVIEFATTKTQEIQVLSQQLIAAQNAATLALEKVKVAKDKAEEAQQNATALKEKKTGFFSFKSKAIEETKSALIEVAEAESEISKSQIVLAEAQQRAVEAQEKSFEFQQKLAQATAMMITFSVTSIATSRTMVQELEKRLNGASQEELSDLARREIQTVVCQIKAQQDMMGRQNQLAEILHEQAGVNEIQDRAIQEQMQLGAQHGLQISAQGQALREQQRVLRHQLERNEALERKIGKIEHDDDVQDQLLAEGAEKDKEQDTVIVAIQEAHEEQKKQVMKNREMTEKHEKILSSLKIENEKQREEISVLQGRVEKLQEELFSKGNKKALIAPSLVAVLALIFSILHFFL